MGVGRECVRVLGLQLGQQLGGVVGDLGHIRRIEPDMRIVAAVFVRLMVVIGIVGVVVVVLGGGAQCQEAGGIQHVGRALLLDGFVQGSLIARLVED